MILKYYETNNSQYHAGHHLPVVQVMVDGRTTWKEVQEMLKDGFAYGHLEDQVFKAESYYDEYYRAVDEWFALRQRRGSAPEKWDATLGVPDNDDEEWDCYAFFVVDGVDEHIVEALRENPGVCPFCGYECLHSHNTEEANVIGILCPECNRSWDEHYNLEEAVIHDN